MRNPRTGHNYDTNLLYTMLTTAIPAFLNVQQVTYWMMMLSVLEQKQYELESEREGEITAGIIL